MFRDRSLYQKSRDSGAQLSFSCVANDTTFSDLLFVPKGDATFRSRMPEVPKDSQGGISCMITKVSPDCFFWAASLDQKWQTVARYSNEAFISSY
jgi:hypothetical protein